LARRFIQQAIKHPGSLRAFAKRHNALTPGGTVNLTKVRRAANREKGAAKLRRIRQVNLAENLRRLRA
jgi:hypothetical protein